MKRLAFLMVFGCLLFAGSNQVHASDIDGNAQYLRVYESNELLHESLLFDRKYRGSASLTTVDLGSDDISEILIGAGEGELPTVSVYNQGSELIGDFLAYAESYTGGIHVAACDVDGDGRVNIITAPRYGGGPHIRIFDPWGNVLNQFFAYDQDFTGGLHLTCGDLDGDGIAEIITGPAIGGGPHVKVFNQHGDVKTEFFSGSATDVYGATVSTLDVNGDGDDELLVGASIGHSYALLFDYVNDHMQYVLGIETESGSEAGITFAPADIDQDGMEEIGVISRGETNTITYYEMTGAIRYELTLDHQEGKTFIASWLEENGKIATLSIPTQTYSEQGQYIRVDISDQTAYAYQDGHLIQSFLVSTGLSYYPTPLGRTTVTDKLRWHDYTWSYGEDNPNNYDLKDVEYNLRFRPHYYLHSAYWHNNFGYQMSHGCVNIDYDHAAWVYNWADVGAVVEIMN